ncbi:MAG: hypothetical protein Q9166_007107 [cf. Caloplaca sp. 2 TL-2023]
MEPITRFLIGLFTCLPAIRAQATNDPKQIKEWQNQYNQYIPSRLWLSELRSARSKSSNPVECSTGSLSAKQRIDYTNAVQCLQKKPNVISRLRVPGAHTRFDDVIATHVFQPPYLHFSGIYLHWHRYYTYIYDRLRTECAPTGPQPYRDPRKSKIFDGSPDSMGSNGAYVPNRNGTYTTAFGRNRTIPAATGGGCNTSGPFLNYTVDLGPASYEPRVGSGMGLDYDVPCLKRDV